MSVYSVESFSIKRIHLYNEDVDILLFNKHILYMSWTKISNIYKIHLINNQEFIINISDDNYDRLLSYIDP